MSIGKQPEEASSSCNLLSNRSIELVRGTPIVCTTCDGEAKRISIVALCVEHVCEWTFASFVFLVHGVAHGSCQSKLFLCYRLGIDTSRANFVDSGFKFCAKLYLCQPKLFLSLDNGR